MSVSFYDFLAAKQAQNRFVKSDEMTFFLSNRVVLAPFESMNKFLKASDPFQIVRANILIRGLLNKKMIEKLYHEKNRKKKNDSSLSLEEFMALGMSDLPYLHYQNEKIYIPSFSSTLNRIYSRDFTKLGKEPYENLFSTFEPLLIDAFDYYGNALYDSYFTKLVKISEQGNVITCFDYDADALYFINDQGRLDAKLALFDKYLEKVNKTHMITRLLNVSDAYFNRDKEGLITALLENGFVSLRFISEYCKKEGSR